MTLWQEKRDTVPVEESRGLPADLDALRIVTTGARYFMAAGSR